MTVNLQFLPNQPLGDNVGVSRLAIYCSAVDDWGPGLWVMSVGPDLGSWTSALMCPEDYYLVSFRQLVCT